MTTQELFDQALSRLSGKQVRCTIFDALREVQGIIASQLLMRRSDLLKAPVPAEIMYVKGEQSSRLPSNFKALDGRPYLSDGSILAPLGQISPTALIAPGKPSHYDLANFHLRIYPPPLTTATVRVPYYFKLTTPTSMTDELPFNGEFDGVILEGCVGMMIAGLTIVADRGFVTVVASQVDAVLAARERIAEQALADAINGV